MMPPAMRAWRYRRYIGPASVSAPVMSSIIYAARTPIGRASSATTRCQPAASVKTSRPSSGARSFASSSHSGTSRLSRPMADFDSRPVAVNSCGVSRRWNSGSIAVASARVGRSRKNCRRSRSRTSRSGRRLRALRLELAREQDVPPYVIFHDATLREMLARRPTDVAELSDVPGVGKKKRDAYGRAFVETIARTCELKGDERSSCAPDGANTHSRRSVPPARQKRFICTRIQTAATLPRLLGYPPSQGEILAVTRLGGPYGARSSPRAMSRHGTNAAVSPRRATDDGASAPGKFSCQEQYESAIVVRS